jgi:hypothetical protein
MREERGFILLRVISVDRDREIERERERERGLAGEGLWAMLLAGPLLSVKFFLSVCEIMIGGLLCVGLRGVVL